MILQDSVFYKAYHDMAVEMWSGLFDKEIEDVCYYMALDAFSREGVFAVNKRRELQVSYMEGLYSRKYPQDLLKRAEHIVPTDNSFIRRALNNLCMVYNTNVARQWDKGGEKQAQLLDLISYDDFLDKVHKLGKFNGNVLVFVGYDGKKIRLQTLTNAWYRWKNIGTQDKPDWELWVAVIKEKAQNKIAYDVQGYGNNYEWNYHVWNSKEYRKVDREGENITTPITNKYKTIPFVEVDFAQTNKYDYYDNSSGMYDLLEKQLLLNTLQFGSFASAAYSNVSILHLDNIEIEDPTSFGLGKIIETKTNEDDPERVIQFVNANGNFTETDTYRNNIAKDTLKNLGLPSAVVESGGVMSGEALKIDRIELEEQRKADIKTMEYYEKEISKMIDIVSRAEGNPYNLGEYTITYNELEVIGDPEKKYNLSKIKFDNDLISIYDFMRDIGYIGTNEELKEIYKQLIEVNSEFRVELSQTSRPSNSNAEAEGTTTTTAPNNNDETNGIAATDGTSNEVSQQNS